MMTFYMRFSVLWQNLPIKFFMKIVQCSIKFKFVSVLVYFDYGVAYTTVSGKSLLWLIPEWRRKQSLINWIPRKQTLLWFSTREERFDPTLDHHYPVLFHRQLPLPTTNLTSEGDLIANWSLHSPTPNPSVSSLPLSSISINICTKFSSSIEHYSPTEITSSREKAPFLTKNICDRL